MKHRTEEVGKVSKLLREKPAVLEKMQKFNDMVVDGKSIAIIRIEYRYNCNLNCQHCCVSPFRKHGDRLLTPKDVADITAQADALGLARFVLTGGEPLILPDLPQVVKAMNPERFYINLDTNGWFLTESKARELKAMGVDRVQLSIDSLDPVEHDTFRRRAGSHARCMAAVDASEKAGLDIFIQTVVGKSRLYSQEFLQFVEHFNLRGIGVFVTFLKPVGAAEGSTDICDKDDFAYFDSLCGKHNLFWHLTPGFGRDLGCIAVKAMVSVQPWGDVRPCPYWPRVLGNVFDEPLGVILERSMKAEPFNRYIDTCPVADCGWKEPL